MKAYSRKLTSVNSNSSNKLSSPSTTSAAAVSVTKFGQATFTSVRRKDYENGNNSFVPLKKSLIEDDTPIVKEVEIKPTSKPKVYKFFKSRAPLVNSETTESRLSSSNSPKPLMLNSNSKDDGVKRITATIGRGSANYGRNKSDRNSSFHNSNVAKSVNISEKSSEIKITGDRNFKKVISPTKQTQFVIRNNTSNVRNATVKSVSTPSNVLPVTRGVRASRRLKGIEPDQQAENSKYKTSSIQDVFDQLKDQSEHGTHTVRFGENNFNNSVDSTRITTLIEEATEDIEEATGDIEQATEEIEEVKQIHNIITIDCEELKDLNQEQINSVEEVQSQEQNKEFSSEVNCEIGKDLIEAENLDELPLLNETVESTSQISVNLDSQGMNFDSQPLSFDSQSQTIDSQSSKDDQKTDGDKSDNTMPIRPKKKIFFNRDRNRNKAEFNTKSFFSSNTKDEFDMEIDNKAASSLSQQSNSDKKSGPDNEEEDQYIKLKKIKKAHQCHDLGETEQFDQDIRYYLSGIVSKNTKPMRCLSILGLSQQVMRPEFRMHLRAHDDMPRIIKALMDVPSDSNLAICTATLMFVYNQDRLTMDIDPNALSLMLELLETRFDECSPIEEKHRVKVISLVEEMKSKGHAKYLKLNEITAGKLAMETLLGLTSKRAGDWFKVELRKMKGIDFIVNTVLRCSENYSEEGQMVKIDRCMHVLENVTFNNVENQLYITEYNNGKFISTCISLLENCKFKIISTNDSKIFLSAFFSILRVLTNLTSESDGCKVVGSFDQIIRLLLESLFELPSFIMSDQRFDLMVIILCLCINLVEFCEDMRNIVMNSDKYLSQLIEFLFKKIEEANQVEQQTDHLLESHETVQMTEAMQDNLLTQMISKSGTHMEHSLLAACVCLMFGCSIKDNDQYMTTLKNALPNHSFDPLVEMLEKLRDFAHLADIMTQKGKDRVQKVLQVFKKYKALNN